ncbi:MAG: hypothetical protein ACOCG4_07980 [Methanoculleus sp.]
MTSGAPRKQSLLTHLRGRICSFRRNIEAAGEYDPAVHGPLVEAALPPDYEELGRYWITEGLSLAVIARSIRTNQTEYFLFEPPLSDFEYELLERLFDQAGT